MASTQTYTFFTFMTRRSIEAQLKVNPSPVQTELTQWLSEEREREREENYLPLDKLVVL